jgi:hypothetical protein
MMLFCMMYNMHSRRRLQINNISSSSSGATVHDEPWSLLRLLLQLLKVSQQLKLFTGWGRQPHAQPPNLEGQGIPFCLDHHLCPVRHGRDYQQLRYRRHSRLF